MRILAGLTAVILFGNTSCGGSQSLETSQEATEKFSVLSEGGWTLADQKVSVRVEHSGSRIRITIFNDEGGSCSMRKVESAVPLSEGSGPETVGFKNYAGVPSRDWLLNLNEGFVPSEECPKDAVWVTIEPEKVELAKFNIRSRPGNWGVNSIFVSDIPETTSREELLLIYRYLDHYISTEESHFEPIVNVVDGRLSGVAIASFLFLENVYKGRSIEFGNFNIKNRERRRAPFNEELDEFGLRIHTTAMCAAYARALRLGYDFELFPELFGRDLFQKIVELLKTGEIDNYSDAEKGECFR